MCVYENLAGIIQRFLFVYIHYNEVRTVSCRSKINIPTYTSSFFFGSCRVSVVVFSNFLCGYSRNESEPAMIFSPWNKQIMWPYGVLICDLRPASFGCHSRIKRPPIISLKTSQIKAGQFTNRLQTHKENAPVDMRFFYYSQKILKLAWTSEKTSARKTRESQLCGYYRIKWALGGVLDCTELFHADIDRVRKLLFLKITANVIKFER